MNLYIVDYTEHYQGKEYCRKQHVYAYEIDHASVKWDTMRLPHQRTQKITQAA